MEKFVAQWNETRKRTFTRWHSRCKNRLFYSKRLINNAHHHQIIAVSLNAQQLKINVCVWYENGDAHGRVMSIRQLFELGYLICGWSCEYFDTIWNLCEYIYISYDN